MGQSAAQKIIARAAGRDHVEPGDYVDVTPDYTCCQEISWSARKAIMERAGLSEMAAPERSVMVVDHTSSASMGTPYYRAHKEMKDFAREKGARFFGAGTGLRHLVLTENGFAQPGALVFSDEPNIASIGVVGALNVPVSTEVVVTQFMARNWMVVPRPVRIHLDGTLAPGVHARDLVQSIIRDFALTDTLSQSCVEYAGPAIGQLGLDARQTILACTYHAGADTALMPVDAMALDFARSRSPGRQVTAVEADADAVYAFEARYDLSALVPMVTEPPELHLVRPAGEMPQIAIDQAAIGSCAGCYLDDMRAAARILTGRRVAPGVTFYITPGSREVYSACAREGLLETFMAAGATVLAPGCTTCWGYEGHLNAGEVQVSTHQMNYRGRNGSRESHSYLAGPFVVAASAVAGRIIDPRPFLQGMN
ncbi:MAG: aconitase family protein [Pseudomonadota bacterium]|nr:aconitase family protein [Pseudomonadota bacterium]